MFRILKKDDATRARAGVIETPHGIVETPAFVVVGTHAKVRTLDASDLHAIGTQIIIANTYHLWRTLGEKGLTDFPGLHTTMEWNRTLMTDSGGFQVFSMGIAREHGTSKVAAKPKEKPTSEYSNVLENIGITSLNENTGRGVVKITEDGVVFTDNGVRYWLDAEKSVRIQQQLGADIIIAFDEPTSPRHDRAYTITHLKNAFGLQTADFCKAAFSRLCVFPIRIAPAAATLRRNQLVLAFKAIFEMGSKQSLVRTHAWALRSLKAKTSNQFLYGVVQGGSFEDLRKQSAQFIGALDFDGIAIGGSYSNSFGSTRERTIKELDWTVPHLPEDKPRHLLGIGLVEDIFAGVAAGIDTFDCVVPTREARHGSLWTSRGRIDIKKAIYRDDKSVLDRECACIVCAQMKIEKGALHAMFRDKNPEAGRFSEMRQQAARLATLHNISFFNLLMSRIRASILNGRFFEEKRHILQKHQEYTTL